MIRYSFAIYPNESAFSYIQNKSNCIIKKSDANRSEASATLKYQLIFICYLSDIFGLCTKVLNAILRQISEKKQGWERPIRRRKQKDWAYIVCP